jgi:hypothetical protein
LVATEAWAEVGEVRLGQLFGAVYLPAMVMESQQLVEKHLTAAGIRCAQSPARDQHALCHLAFHEAEIKVGLRTITSGFDFMGGPTTGVTFTSHDKFRAENPKVFAAVMRAFAGSFEWINADKRRTARLCVE